MTTFTMQIAIGILTIWVLKDKKEKKESNSIEMD